MEYIYSVVNRVAQAVGLSSATPSDVEHTQYTSGPVTANRSASRSTDIIHIAFLLHHKLPADLVPMILEHAELWETTRLAHRHRPEKVMNGESPRLYAGAVVPHHLPRGSVRLIRFTTVSRDQGWSSYSEDHDTYNNSWTWFEAGITGLDGDLVPKSERSCYDGDNLSNNFPHSRSYKYGSRRIVTNLHAHRRCLEHIVEWRFDDADEDLRHMLRELKGGCGIEVSTYAKFFGWANHVKSVTIDIECPVVRKM